MKTLAEYQRDYRRRLKEKHKLKEVRMHLTLETDAKLEALAIKYDTSKNKVLNFLKLE